jgi:DNA-binding beta-propeller fold protein YncE
MSVAVALAFVLATHAAVRAASPTLLVLNKGNQTLVTVDPATLKVTGSYPSGPDPHEVIASSDGKTAYITNYTQGNTISVVDLVAKKVLAPIDLGGLLRPHGLAFAGGKLYFTAEGSKSVARYDPAARKIDLVVGTGQDGTHMVLLTSDLKQMITTNIGSASVSFIDQVTISRGGGSATDWRVSNVPAGRGAEGYDLSPNGKELWVCNAADRTVSIIDAVNKKPITTLNVPVNMGNRLKFTPDGKYVFISDIRGREVLVLDAAARKEAKRIPVEAENAAGLLMEPNGNRAFVSVGAHNAVAVIDTKALTLTGWVESGPGPDGVAWAPAAQ